MSAAEVFVVWLALGAGVGIAGFWAGVLLMRKVDALGEFGVSRAWHIAAEFVTAALLVAGGVAFLVERTEASRALVAAGFGALVYAGVQSPGYYRRKAPWLAWVLGGTIVAAVAGIVVLLAGAG